MIAIILVAIPYKSGKYSYGNPVYETNESRSNGVAIPYKSGKYSYFY